MSRSKSPTFADLPPAVQVLILFFVGLLVVWTLYGQIISEWWLTNRWWIISLLVLLTVTGIIFYLKVIMPSRKKKREEVKKIISLERNIIRKDLLKRRSKELEGLSEEEKEFQLSKWIDEKLYGGANRKTNREFERVPPLPAKFTARFINAIGNRCENPRCRNDYGLQVHHIHPRGEGGTNQIKNLIAVCPTCHAKAHRGAFSRDLLREWTRRPHRFRFKL